MSVYGFMDKEKQDPKTWVLAAAVQKRKDELDDIELEIDYI